MATLKWEAVGGDPAPGDSAAFDQLARAFAAMAGNAGDAQSKLSTFAASVDDRIWQGEAADAFREKMGELPPQPVKLHESHQAASQGMAGYARELDDLQAQACVLLARAQAAQDDQDAQTCGRDQALAQDPTASMTGYDRSIDDARQRFQDACRQIGDLRGRRQEAENAALVKLAHAQDLGIANDPWHKRAWDAIDRWIDERADILRGLSNILRSVSAAAGLLSLIPGLGVIFAPIALIAGGGALLLNAALAATGNGGWRTLLFDAALIALPGSGPLLTVFGDITSGDRGRQDRRIRSDRVTRNPEGGRGATFQAEIENGEGIVGYQYLHGTNKDAGGFNTRGNASLRACLRIIVRGRASSGSAHAPPFR
ncbi:MAG: WXG100 family type VII secretion target, partial [Egibacteraceae bacterium]